MKCHGGFCSGLKDVKVQVQSCAILDRARGPEIRGVRITLFPCEVEWNWTFKIMTSIFSSYDKFRIFISESGNVLKYANIPNLEDLFSVLKLNVCEEQQD